MRSSVKIENGYIPDTWNLISELCIYSTLKKKTPQLINYQTQSVLKHLDFLVFRYNSKSITIARCKCYEQLITILSKCLLSQPEDVNFYHASPSYKTLYKYNFILILFTQFLKWSSAIQHTYSMHTTSTLHTTVCFKLLLRPVIFRRGGWGLPTRFLSFSEPHYRFSLTQTSRSIAMDPPIVSNVTGYMHKQLLEGRTSSTDPYFLR